MINLCFFSLKEYFYQKKKVMEMNKATNKIKNNAKQVLRLTFLIFILGSLTSCEELNNFFASDSGYDLSIRNFTDKEFKGCKFYMGAFDENKNFIATDSLMYPDLIIYKKTEGVDINVEQGYSRTYPFRESKEGLNEYGYWEPNIAKIREITGGINVTFKFELSDGSYDFTDIPYTSANGSISTTINEQGISW